MRTTVRAAYLASGALLLFTLIAYAVGSFAESYRSPSLPSIQVAPGFCFSAGPSHGIPAFAFFNQPSGPYTGSIISVQGSQPQSSVTGYTWPGFYYRYIVFPSGAVIWTLLISPLYFLALSALGPLMAVVLRRYRKVAAPRLAACYWTLLAFGSVPFADIDSMDYMFLVLLRPACGLAGMAGLAWLLWSFFPKRSGPGERVAEKE
jgi:hypothetical protein